MSFQHFRLGEVTPVHHLQQAASQPIPAAASISSAKQPYGSGDSEDGYTLVFTNLDEFQAWRQEEEERNCVEFVKGDTHGSKADPPRFKEHTKLVCARHSRSGRKKYVKKHPERVRKVPSRKLEGTGCQASISYKTYFDSEQIRACYIQHHSHPIGAENLPFTRRGRKAAVLADKDRGSVKSGAPDEDQEMNMASTSTDPQVDATLSTAPLSAFSSAVSMLAPLPGQPFAAAPQAQTFNFQPPVEYGIQPPNQERWDNMGTLFQTVRDHARSYNYPAASVAALETVLIRLYLESPIGSIPQAMVNPINRSQPPNTIQMQSAVNSPPTMNGSTSNGNNEGAENKGISHIM